MSKEMPPWSPRTSTSRANMKIDISSSRFRFHVNTVLRYEKLEFQQQALTKHIRPKREFCAESAEIQYSTQSLLFFTSKMHILKVSSFIEKVNFMIISGAVMLRCFYTIPQNF